MNGWPLRRSLVLASLLLALARTHALAESLGTDELNNIEVFKRASPAAVYITNIQLRRDPFSLDVLAIPRGTGTGIVWDKQGYIVTNYHVVEGANRVAVGLYDQSTYEAKLVGVAPDKDIAVLRIEAPAEKLQPLPLGNADQLQVGRKVLAIGNPFGLDSTLTTGVVSALGREISAPNGRRIRGMIQTDAAINPGNSGGPLLDSAGRLIGINSAIIGPSGANAGIGFAVPVNIVRKVVPDLIKFGRQIRPVLEISTVDDAITQRLGLTGVIVGDVAPDGPAGQAGLRGVRRAQDGGVILGDVITALNQLSVHDNDDLLNALEQFKPGDTVTLTTRRENKERHYQIRLGAPE